MGIQAQDLRAARLALRSRIAGLERGAVDTPGLVRTWTVRGTVHLLDAGDLAWLHALTGPRNRRYFDGLIEKRGNLALARAMRGDIVAVLEEQGPATRAEVLGELAARGRHEELGPRSVNVIIPRLVVGARTDRRAPGAGRAGRGGRRGGPRRPAGHVRRRASSSAHRLAPRRLRHDHARPPDARAHVLPGGGMLRPVVLARGRATGTWRTEGSGPRRTLAVSWFGRPAARRALEAEARDVGRFLGLELRVAT